MITCFQNYWWLLISVLGAALVFLLFVQGGQTLLPCLGNNENKRLAVNALGRKWELTYTTLVVFGAGFFASFPLFYSTSFGGAWALWMLILFSFVIQAASYEFRRKRGNLYGTGFYDTLLFLNGSLGCILLGVAVGTMIFGAEFNINKVNITDPSAPIISTWANSLHGLEALGDWRCLLLGFAILFLARMNGAFFLMLSTDGSEAYRAKLRRIASVSGLIFVPLIVLFLIMVLLQSSLVQTSEGFVSRQYGYLMNYLEMWWAAVALLVGVVCVLVALFCALVKKPLRYGFWLSGVGTVLVVMSLFWVMGYNSTAYFPSLADPQASLTLANSSSSLFTLRTMTWVSAVLPIVIAYIAYVWHSMGRRPINATDLSNEGEY